MKNRTSHYLIGSLIGVALLCVLVFSVLTLHMRKESTDTINEVGALYMSSMSQQISLHFETFISMQLEEVEALAQAMNGETIHESPAEQSDLAKNAQALNFPYLAFYTEDGSFEMLYGDPIKLDDPAPFLQSLKRGERKVAIGEDSSGNVVVLMGVPSPHAPTGEHPCVALVGAVPMSVISETLSLEENEHIYSFIVRRDGTFVIRSSGVTNATYFDRVREMYGSVGELSPEEFIEVLGESMDRDEEYSSEFTLQGERRHLYCTHLAHTEWYLLTFMPYGTMDSIVNHLSSQWTVMSILSGGIIIAVLLLVFSKYFKLTRKQMRELYQARCLAEQANRAKSEFLSNMSHDIRTPMNAIVGMTAIATANIDNQQRVQHCLKKIALSSKHLLGLINDVLDMSKIESGKMTLNMDQISLREVVDGIVNICQPQVKAKKQGFDIRIHDISSENVLCDSVRLNQVFLNLLSNAIKFTPEGGRIEVSLYETPSSKGEDYVQIHVSVKDNGIGMSEEFVTHIFDSFTREDSARVRRTEGTGLGMAITKHIVDAMGGTIVVESQQGAGTEFTVIVDLEKAKVLEEDMVLPNWNMLVVDDDQELCETTVSALKTIGVNADWTLDGESAVEMVKDRCRGGNAYEIILLDWKLPDQDGIATARRIRQELGESEVPILLISAYDWGEIEDEAREAGITGFIAKPLFRSTLFNSLRHYMGAQEAGLVPEARKANALNGRRLLLAEDNELNWEIASELLTEEGLAVEWAENGEICVEMFRDSQPGYYDAILMDIRMPIMGGYEATQVIRALEHPDKDLPIIAMTADAFAEDVKRSLECGMNAHVAKPIDVGEVMRLLEKYILRSQNT